MKTITKEGWGGLCKILLKPIHLLNKKSKVLGLSDFSLACLGLYLFCSIQKHLHWKSSLFPKHVPRGATKILSVGFLFLFFSNTVVSQTWLVHLVPFNFSCSLKQIYQQCLPIPRLYYFYTSWFHYQILDLTFCVYCQQWLVDRSLVFLWLCPYDTTVGWSTPSWNPSSFCFLLLLLFFLVAVL